MEDPLRGEAIRVKLSTALLDLPSMPPGRKPSLETMTPSLAPLAILLFMSLNATWPQTLAGTNGTFNCSTGYFTSNTSVYCSQNGATAFWVSYPCGPVYCPAGSLSDSSWPQTLGDYYGTYICAVGYYAAPNSSVFCTQNGGSATWGTIPCQPFTLADQQNLVAFYNELAVKPEWNTTISLCGQQGVMCSNTHVAVLSLAGLGLTGTIATELGQLSQLTSL